MKAVRFDEYGGVDVLKVVDVPVPEPGLRQVLVRVKAAGINPGEAKIRDGLLHERWPAAFPEGEGSDLAGMVEAEHLTPKPASLPWEIAGALLVVGFTAWAAVRAVALKTGETLVVSGAAGGV